MLCDVIYDIIYNNYFMLTIEHTFKSTRLCILTHVKHNIS